ncbi:hypothetical protein [Actinoallomurus vinaceus]|uniref:hypothetical protein n=1 Tax=Actinoallomurus vinaceus TaxID=1080074 RepID=UPI0031EE8696
MGAWARIETKVLTTRAEQGLPPTVEDVTTLHAIATLMHPDLVEAGQIGGFGGRKAA